MANYQYLTRGNDDGAIIGGSSDKIGFFGATPVTQRTNVADISTTGMASTVTVGAYINSILGYLEDVGLMASA